MSSLYQKLAILQKTVRGLAPDMQGGSSSAAYRYVSGSKVLDIVRPKMDELGMLLVQQVDSIENERMDYQVKTGAKSEILTKVMMTFTWIDSESGETLPVRFGANGQNGWDKGLGSALTYAERYFLLKFFHIATDEDDVDARPDEEAKPLPARDADGWHQPEKFPKPERKQAPAAKKRMERNGRAWNSAVARVAGGEQGLMDKIRASYEWDEQMEADFADDVFNYNLDNRNDDGKLI